MKKNLFIALEGIDGSGKSTQAKLLSENLTAAGHRVHATFEPTDGPIGRIIRDMLNHRISGDHRTIAALFVADRLHHLLDPDEGMLSKLAAGYTVISDRYYFSSYAYHSVHMNMDWVIQANSLSAGLLKPDLNIFIDITPELSMERLNKGRNAREIYENYDNLKQVREKYFEAFNQLSDQERILIIPGDRPSAEIAADIWHQIQEIA